ncbi:uncharacterized protein LOC142586950 [Dermacentor variabilis]|uniref:uncharacterized protein LOC142586950 n=1 Tax=Dermacentor variabilis TaxID=34621 RepID=UPI003F5C4331
MNIQPLRNTTVTGVQISAFSHIIPDIAGHGTHRSGGSTTETWERALHSFTAGAVETETDLDLALNVKKHAKVTEYYAWRSKIIFLKNMSRNGATCLHIHPMKFQPLKNTTMTGVQISAFCHIIPDTAGQRHRDGNRLRGGTTTGTWERALHLVTTCAVETQTTLILAQNVKEYAKLKRVLKEYTKSDEVPSYIRDAKRVIHCSIDFAGTIFDQFPFCGHKIHHAIYYVAHM